MKKATPIYQVQIALRGFKPKIWRRIQLSSDTLFLDFHRIVQTTMGWTDSHLHQFVKDGTFYSTRMFGDDTWGEMGAVDYKKMKISDLLKSEKDKMIYEYDFGDSWEHQIILEKILSVDDKIKYPICLTGKMSCPPEDCGGVWGYADILEILKQPDHEEYEHYIDWMGEEFDPTLFDKDEVNQALQGK